MSLEQQADQSAQQHRPSEPGPSYETATEEAGRRQSSQHSKTYHLGQTTRGPLAATQAAAEQSAQNSTVDRSSQVLLQNINSTSSNQSSQHGHTKPCSVSCAGPAGLVPATATRSVCWCQPAWECLQEKCALPLGAEHASHHEQCRTSTSCTVQPHTDLHQLKWPPKQKVCLKVATILQHASRARTYLGAMSRVMWIAWVC